MFWVLKILVYFFKQKVVTRLDLKILWDIYFFLFTFTLNKEIIIVTKEMSNFFDCWISIDLEVDKLKIIELFPMVTELSRLRNTSVISRRLSVLTWVVFLLCVVFVYSRIDFLLVILVSFRQIVYTSTPQQDKTAYSNVVLCKLHC